MRYGILGRIFPGHRQYESVVTTVQLNASPQMVWERMMMYEEVPVAPPLLLRILLPYPLRSVGEKTRVGADIQCIYKGGEMVKKITAAHAPYLLEFDVTEQKLGIESCIKTVRGSYAMRATGTQTEVVLTTEYEGQLGPRWMWRPLETFFGRYFHHHILKGLKTTLPDIPLETECTTSSSRSQP